MRAVSWLQHPPRWPSIVFANGDDRRCCRAVSPCPARGRRAIALQATSSEADLSQQQGLERWLAGLRESLWKAYRPDPVLACIGHWCGTKRRVMLQVPVHARGGVP